MDWRGAISIQKIRVSRVIRGFFPAQPQAFLSLFASGWNSKDKQMEKEWIFA
jgi:hypothetical protein